VVVAVVVVGVGFGVGVGEGVVGRGWVVVGSGLEVVVGVVGRVGVPVGSGVAGGGTGFDGRPSGGGTGRSWVGSPSTRSLPVSGAAEPGSVTPAAGGMTLGTLVSTGTGCPVGHRNTAAITATAAAAPPMLTRRTGLGPRWCSAYSNSGGSSGSRRGRSG
jgi:hypothetical protein